MLARIAVLTVSDTAAANPAADLSGPTIREIVSLEGGSIAEGFHCIVPDDKKEIARIITEWCASGKVDWVITTGGTGFGVRDVTPEALAPLIERPAPGLVHLLLSSSLKQTPYAALSRPVAGTLNNTLITTLPGSVKAVKENLQTLLSGGLIMHALDLIKGGSGRQVHSQLAIAQDAAKTQQDGHTHDSDHHHHHHHHHHVAPKPRSKDVLSHDPLAPVTARLRKSPFPQISLETALDLIRQKLQRLEVVSLPINVKLVGHILAEDVHATHDIPSTFTTSVDGYALRSTDQPDVYNVLTSQTHNLSDDLPPKSIYRINTGGPLPSGSDTVIMVEDTRIVSVQGDTPSGLEEEKEVETLVQIPPFENVRRPGSDVKEGELVFSKGDKITRGGGELGTLAFIGRQNVKVYKKPVVAILSTGNEIIDLHDKLDVKVGADGWGGVYDTNRPSLNAALVSMGYEVLDLGIVTDDIFSHLNALRKGLDLADVIVTTGGTSMGPTDLLKPIIERYLNGVIHFGRVSVKPGKPTTFATVPVDSSSSSGWKPIFALPGNPASALVTFYVFVVPALRKMGGWSEGACQLPKVTVQIQNVMPLDPRTEFHRVVIKSNLLMDGDTKGSSVPFKAYSTGGQRSSRATSLCKANGLVVLPPVSAGKKCLEVGEFAQAILIGEIEME